MNRPLGPDFSGRKCVRAVALALIACLNATCAAAAEPTKILLVGHLRDHPYETHEYLVDAGILAKCLRQHPGVVAEVSNDWPADPRALADVDAIVLHVASGGDFLLGGPHREEAEKLLARGVGLTAIHWSTGCENDEVGHHYQKALGGRFSTKFSRLEHVELPLRRAATDHPIARGWDGFPLHDEYYLDLRLEPTAVAIAEVERGGKTHPVAWAYTRGDRGRSFGCVLGHYHRNFAEAPFRRLLVNGILWTANVEPPHDGAAVEIEPGDLELPPDEPRHRKQ